MTRRKGILLLAVPAALWLAASPGCLPRTPRLQPPLEISSLQGYASLRFSGEMGGFKSRFSFQVLLPGRGRVEVFDVLGRLVFYFVLDGEAARFVLPRQKAYCPAGSDEVMARFLGFSLGLEEWTALIGGRWPGAEIPGGESLGWTLRRDGRGRVVSGGKGDAHFEVQEFFPGGPTPRRLSFGGARGAGSLTVLDLRFNAPPPDSAFPAAPPEGFRAVTWTEIEELLRGEG